MQQRNQLTKVFCIKNEKRFNNTEMNKLENNVLIFSKKYILFCSPKFGDIPLGFKYHWLFHLLEFVQHYNFSPSWMDGQRIESYHPFIKRTWIKFQRMGTEKQMKNVCKRLNAISSLTVK